MPLRRRQDLGSHIDDPIFGARDLANSLPKYRFPEHENRPKDIYQVVSDELYLDGNARQNLATFCQTWEEPEVHKLMNLAIDKNMIDKTEYLQTAEIEIRCTHMLADLWNAPVAATTVGTSTIGSSEACMLGGMAAKWRWKARRKAQGKPADKPNLVCGPVQVCWAKFCRCKRADSPYRAGPSKKWLKVKNRTHPSIVRVKDAIESGRFRRRSCILTAEDRGFTPAGSCVIP